MAWTVYQRSIPGRKFRWNNYLFQGTSSLKKKEEVWGEMTRRYWNINLEEMMEAGVHFGHGTRKWNPRMAPYISL